MEKIKTVWPIAAATLGMPVRAKKSKSRIKLGLGRRLNTVGAACTKLQL